MGGRDVRERRESQLVESVVKRETRAGRERVGVSVEMFYF